MKRMLFLSSALLLYGVIMQYLRMKGIVPPSTANAAAARGRGN